MQPELVTDFFYEQIFSIRRGRTLTEEDIKRCYRRNKDKVPQITRALVETADIFRLQDDIAEHTVEIDTLPEQARSLFAPFRRLPLFIRQKLVAVIDEAVG